MDNIRTKCYLFKCSQINTLFMLYLCNEQDVNNSYYAITYSFSFSFKCASSICVPVRSTCLWAISMEDLFGKR
ncbi:hypothetical protein T05_11252 [Trichinella murrelli]|uniref:Uncharacterized protein n=1 Tax=Trichinella murrelli TaxID=144512 RepID=A0A0V0UEW9_9BILA|nr:hypothetical protein T05_11252 [Trichinella murrelli]